jgi:predicted HicB family RNase H-like nuclease
MAQNININIGEELHSKLRLLAAKRKVTIKNLVIEILQESVTKLR